MKLDQVSKFMEQAGFPGRDGYDLSYSRKTFPDGANWRIEIGGVDGPRMLETVIAERKKWDIPVHRVIALNCGSSLFSDQEIRDFAQLAHEDKIEVIATLAPRPGWDIGRQYVTPDGSHYGAQSIRGQDIMRQIIAEIFRLYDLGLRGFFLTDPGLLHMCHIMQEQGNLPKDITIKVGVGAGVANAVAAKVFQDLGAASINPQSDHPIPQLASIRKAIDIPIDFYIMVFDTFGGAKRIHESAEVAKVCSPTYFKFEPAIDYTISSGLVPEDPYIDLMKKKIKWAKWVVDFIAENEPSIKLSEQGPLDLHIPVVK